MKFAICNCEIVYFNCENLQVHLRFTILIVKFPILIVKCSMLVVKFCKFKAMSNGQGPAAEGVDHEARARDSAEINFPRFFYLFEPFGQPWGFCKFSVLESKMSLVGSLRIFWIISPQPFFYIFEPSCIMFESPIPSLPPRSQLPGKPRVLKVACANPSRAS